MGSHKEMRSTFAHEEEAPNHVELVAIHASGDDALRPSVPGTCSFRLAG